jgi:uncharacterized membrane protein YecN with MAPEG domain
MLSVTALYAGLLGLISLGLAMPAGRLRGATKISVGDGGDPDLLLAMRRHANFVEYVPMALILLGILELNGVSHTAIHVLGGVLVVARIAHATGLRGDTIQGAGRLIGAMGTMLVSVVLSIWAIATFF